MSVQKQHLRRLSDGPEALRDYIIADARYDITWQFLAKPNIRS